MAGRGARGNAGAPLRSRPTAPVRGTDIGTHTPGRWNACARGRGTRCSLFGDGGGSARPTGVSGCLRPPCAPPPAPRHETVVLLAGNAETQRKGRADSCLPAEMSWSAWAAPSGGSAGRGFGRRCCGDEPEAHRHDALHRLAQVAVAGHWRRTGGRGRRSGDVVPRPAARLIHRVHKRLLVHRLPLRPPEVPCGR